MSEFTIESASDVRATVRAFVVRSESGEVIHVHQEITFADTPKQDEAPEQRSLRLAGPSGRQVEEVNVDDLPVPEFRAPVNAIMSASRAMVASQRRCK